MNNAKVKTYLKSASEALTKCEIADSSNSIISTYQSNISAFESAIANGSFKAAVAFFSDDADGSKVKRSQLISAMYYIVKQESLDAKEICKKIFELSPAEQNALRRDFINAAAALKRTMMLFDLK